jgi:hypothetical protein
MFQHRDDFSIAELENPAIWDDLKKRVRRMEQTNFAGRDCAVMEFDYADKGVLYRVYFANDLAYYPVKVQVLSKGFQRVAIDLTVEEIKQCDTQNGLVVFPLVINQVNMNPETGHEVYTIKYSVDQTRFSINTDIPDDVFTIPLHMIREYEDADDPKAYFNADDIADRGLEQLSLDRGSEPPKDRATKGVTPSPSGVERSSEDPPIPPGTGTPNALGKSQVKSLSGPGRVAVGVCAILLVLLLVGRGIYHHRRRAAR